MFNNIIYFILVLLIFNTNYPDNAPKTSLLFSFSMLVTGWLMFSIYCRHEFQRVVRQVRSQGLAEGRLTAQYQRLTVRLSVLAIFLFALAVYLLNLKYWLQMVPGFEQFVVLQGTLALLLYFWHLGTMWYFAHPAYEAVFRTGLSKRSFVRSNFRFNLPILFPWAVLSLLYDVVRLSPWSGPNGFLSGMAGQVTLFAGFLALLMIFMPRFVQYWWNCKPLPASEKSRKLDAFLRDRGFKYRRLLRWPLFEGRMMTAGIMGIVSRFRYILITDSLLEVLSAEELKAVLSHEMGHAKYRHLLFYLIFFVGFMILSLGLFDIFFYLLLLHPYFIKMLSTPDPQGISLFYLALSIPMLVMLVIYFRYVMGFFMRNFERQADLYSARIMGTPQHTITSLEKIALFSGKSRHIPSWHHFSIKERVDYLLKTIRHPRLERRHHRFVAVSFLVYLIGLGGLGYFLNFSSAKDQLTYRAVESALSRQLLSDPHNTSLRHNLAMIYHQTGQYAKAIEAYDQIIMRDPDHSASLNNLAWILVTAPREELRDNGRALALAKRAVALERSAVFLDTLAEAYYANGQIQEAVRTIKSAIGLATEDRSYYRRQLKKFQTPEDR